MVATVGVFSLIESFLEIKKKLSSLESTREKSEYNYFTS